MTPREKILRDGLIDISRLSPKGYAGEVAEDALKQADEIKDGLSHEDLDKIKPARTERLGHGYGG